MHKAAEKYLSKYLSTLPSKLANLERVTDSFHFCGTQHNADLSAILTRDGKKLATASLEWCFTFGSERYPEVGELDVITDWNKNPVCIIEITKTQISPFDEVTESFAIEEGEGSLSLHSWRKIHWEFFSQECKQLDKEPSENMPILLQWFKVVYSK